MKILLLFLIIVIPFEEIQFEDFKGNRYDIIQDNYILIFLNGWNCVDCINKTTEYLKSHRVSKNRIFFVIESTEDIYQKLNLKKMIEQRTDYYNAIIFNPNNVTINDVENSYFLKYSDNNRTPAIIIKTDKYYFYPYDSIFLKGNEVKLDSNGVELLRKLKD